MRAHGIADIYMRMLKVIELKRIQGFPDHYVLYGPQQEQKKFIGNSVETGVVKALFQAMSEAKRARSQKAPFWTTPAEKMRG